MGLFDDLISAPPSAPSSEQRVPRGGLFDDILEQHKGAPVPERPRQEPVYDPMGNVAAPGEGITLPPEVERSTAYDVAASIPAGVGLGVAGAVGLPGTLRDFAGAGARQLERVRTGEALTPEEAAARDAQVRAPDLSPLGVAGRVLNPQNARAAIETVTGPFHEPTTTPGRYTRTATEFATGAALMPGGNVARNALVYGAVPGIASEAAKDAVPAAWPEGWRTAAGVAGAVAGGGAGAFLTRPSPAGAAITNAARGATPAQVDAAEALFQEARNLPRPINITRAEALEAVTNGATSIGELQRMLEGYAEPTLRRMMAARPGQVTAAGQEMIDRLGPAPANPYTVGPAVHEAAERTVQDVQGAINAQTRPAYQRAEAARMGEPVAGALATDPLYAETLAEVRGTPALNATIRNLPDDSPAVVDLVQRRLRERAENARIPGQASTSNLAAANYETAREVPIQAAERATGSSPGVVGDYEAARARQADLRERYLDPLMQGPIGRLASRDVTTEQAVNVLFPRRPLPNSAPQIVDAVTAINARSPRVAQDITRTYLEMNFQYATRNLRAGQSEYSGAMLAQAIRGNPQQAENFAAVIHALHGPQGLDGVDRVLRVMEATGYRQPIGSKTAFNVEFGKALEKGGTVQAAVADTASLFTNTPKRVLETLRVWNRGRNNAEIARVLTDPAAGPLFRQLATAPTGSARFGAILTRLVALGTQGSRDRNPRQQ